MNKLLFSLGIGAFVFLSFRYLKEKRESNIIKRHHRQLREQDAAVRQSLEESEKDPG
jgi:hypothetical protein